MLINDDLSQSWSRVIDVLSICIVAALAVFITGVNAHNSYDDAYITYRYSYNFATGNGFVYNLGEKHLGTTAPLFGLLLGVLGLFNPDAIPMIGGYVSGLSLFLVGLALYIYGRLHGQPLCGLLAGIFFVVNPLLPATFGGEMLTQAALIMWAFVAYRTSHTRLAALLLAIAVLTRGDSIIALGIVGLHFIVTRRRFPWQEMLSSLAVLLPFMLLSWMYYGSLLPATLDAKLAQRDSGLWPGFTPGIIEWLRGYTMQGTSRFYTELVAAPNAIRFILFVALGIPALLYYRFWLLPLSWIGLYALGYHLLNVPFYHWYVVPIALGLMILAACGVAGAVELVVRLSRHILGQNRSKAVRVGLGIISLLVLAPGLFAQLAQTQLLSSQEPVAVEILYQKTGQWLEQHTQPTDRIGYFEIGYLGYYARERAIIDPLALVNPDLAPYVARGEWTRAYEQYRPEYIVHNQLIFLPYMGKVVDEPWFRQEYREVTRIGEGSSPPLVIYQRVAAAQEHGSTAHTAR